LTPFQIICRQLLQPARSKWHQLKKTSVGQRCRHSEYSALAPYFKRRY
jgi:hypothetical protein